MGLTLAKRPPLAFGHAGRTRMVTRGAIAYLKSTRLPSTLAFRPPYGTCQPSTDG
ncbi:hypothetical protein BJP36_41310 [Moorena producens JHB]|uniref:Uncharacterized protein n=1 Tax=Moorena producens (strain JHB) TaxID=1454205 RepID=A0A9Q9SSE5_MOOP1|nr:hypothetical protein [Moorena producens]WAN68804.1 hypothetical protein BJP36_41310 [Moorena producens JHB]